MADLSQEPGDLSDLLQVRHCHSRANSMNLYVRYMKSVNVEPFPLEPEKAYQYVGSCRREHAAPSRALEARKGWKVPV